MTDKQIIQTLENIKKHCCGRACSECVFNKYTQTYNYACQIKKIIWQLSEPIHLWNIKKIEEIMKYE